MVRDVAGAVPQPRRGTRARLRDHSTNETIDEALVLWFPAPNSYTGEDLAEFHLHGGRAVVSAVYQILSGIEGLRPADAGEFTRRAFENGKLDLTAAEGIADLVGAETTEQRRQALRQLQGELGRVYRAWSDRLLRAIAQIEALIDFSDEGVPDSAIENAKREATSVRYEIAQHIDDKRRGEILREGIHVAVIGEPNVGKSSLVNQLARRDVAITSPSAGTTRDIIEVHLDIGGYPVIVADTAGLREIADPVEAEGVRRALAKSADADLRLVVIDAAHGRELSPVIFAQMNDDTILVLNKIDLVREAPGDLAGRAIIPISAVTGEGLPELLSAIEQRAHAILADRTRPTLTRERHRIALKNCLEPLGRAIAGGLPELVAEDMRLAMRELGRITGHVDVEQILDVIFREFCIGK